MASRLSWDFGDGVVSSSLSYITSHAWTNSGDYTVTFSAFDTHNPGVSTNLTIHVVPLVAPSLSAGSLSNSTFLRSPGSGACAESRPSRYSHRAVA